MKTITVSDKQYRKIMELKNYYTVKVGMVTNKDLLGKKMRILSVRNLRKYDYDPTLSIGELADIMIDAIWWEQETGNVAYIT
jgi:hypothetical protein